MPRKPKNASEAADTPERTVSLDLDNPTDTEKQMQSEMELMEEALLQEDIPSENEAQSFVPWTYTERKEHEAEYAASRALREKNDLIIGTYAKASTGRIRKILEAVVATAEHEEDTTYLICYDGPVTVKIPIDQMLEELAANMQGKSAQAKTDQMNFANKFIGAKIPFIVTSFVDHENGTYSAYASRIYALRRIRSRYFGSGAPNPVKVGDIVNAQFISVGRYAAYVNVNGVDTRIANYQLTHRFLPEISSAYNAGDTISVMVTSIEKGAKGIPKIEVSGKEAEKLDFPNLLHRFSPGKKCRATVLSVSTQKNLRTPRLLIKLFLDDIELPGLATDVHSSCRNKLIPGEKVVFQMGEIAKNRNSIIGTIISKPR